MKIKQAFKDIEKPEDINQEELSSYLRELYGEEKFDINDPRYLSENREFRANWDNFTYKRQVDRVISELGTLSGLNDFEHLRKHYDRPISAGAARIAAEEEKTFAEYICFKLAKRREKVNFVKFNDEVKAATLSKCIGGAARNMQMIFFSMEQAEYYQKYNFISNIALEYIRDKKLVSAGNEPHAVNKLIHEVSMVYKLVPPRDNYVQYRDLASPAPSNMQRYAEFYPFMDNLMDSRAGVYSLVSFLSSDLMSKFPKVEDLNLVEDDLPVGEDTSSKSILIIKDLLSEMGIDKSHIIKEDINGDYIYVENYQEIIEIIIMQQLMANQMVEFDPIIIDGSPIIETPSGWFLVKRNGDKIDSRKVLDTKAFLGITKDQETMEDFIHTVIYNNKDNYFPAFDEVQVRKLLMKSDQAKKLLDLLGREYVANLSNDSFREHIRLPDVIFFSKDTNINTRLFYAIKLGNIDIVSSLLKLGASPSAKKQDGFSALHFALKLGKNDIALYLIENDANLRNIYHHQNFEVFAISYAIKQNNKELIAAMLAKDPGLLDFIKMRQKNNLLELAPNNEMYSYLLDIGVSPYSYYVNNFNYDASSEFIRQCSSSGNKERLEILLDRGFDPKRGFDNLIEGQSIYSKYTSPLKYIEKYKKEEVFQLMLEKKVITENDLNFVSAFYYALRLGKNDMALRLLENNDLRAFDQDRSNEEFAISHAIKENNKELISLMVTKDPGLLDFIKMRQSTNLLKLAPNNEMYSYLLDIGVSPYSYYVNSFYYDDSSEFIHQCSSGGNKERLEILLNKGFDPRKGFDNLKIDQKNPDDFSCDSALGFIKKHSNINEGVFQLMLARNVITENDRDFVEFDPEKVNFKSSDNKGLPLMHLVISSGCRIDTLIRKGADLNTSRAKNTAMHHAITHSNHHALESLINAGADYSLANKQGNPPLHHAIKSGSLEATNILLKVVDPSLRNEKGQTAIEYIDSLRQTKKIKEIKKIIETKIAEKESLKMAVDAATSADAVPSMEVYDTAPSADATPAMEVDALPSAEAAPSMEVASSTSSSNSWQEKVKKREASPAEIEPGVKRARTNSFVERFKEGKDGEEHKR